MFKEAASCGEFGIKTSILQKETSITARKPQIYLVPPRRRKTHCRYHAGGNTHYLPHGMRERNGNYLPHGVGNESLLRGWWGRNGNCEWVVIEISINTSEVMNFQHECVARVLKIITHECLLMFQITTNEHFHCDLINPLAVTLLYRNCNFDS